MQMLKIDFKSSLFALATCLIGSAALAQSEQSKNELLEDLLSGSDVCVNLGYISEDGVSTERLEYEKKLMSVNQQLAQALAELETIKSEDGKANSSSGDERLDFLRDAAMQCEKKYAALSEEQNSGVEDLGKAITLYKKTVQRLLNKKKCQAGSVDGIIGNQTIRAAERFAYASNFPRKRNLVYDEGFFNHLNSSNRECKVAKTNSIIGSSGINASEILNNTSKTKLEKLNNQQICGLAIRNGKWDVLKAYIPYVKEAKRRGLSCGVSR